MVEFPVKNYHLSAPIMAPNQSKPLNGSAKRRMPLLECLMNKIVKGTAVFNDDSVNDRRETSFLCQRIWMKPPTNHLGSAVVVRLFHHRWCQRASSATYRWDSCTFHHVRLSTDEVRLWTMQLHWDDLTRVSQKELTLSIFHTIRSPIRLVFITSHLVYYSTMTSIDL